MAGFQTAFAGLKKSCFSRTLTPAARHGMPHGAAVAD